MPTLLKNLTITKVALVDEGSCSAAHIKLYKRKGEGGNQVMGVEDILKLLPEDKREEAKAAIEKAKADAKAAGAGKGDGICPNCGKPLAQCTCAKDVGEAVADTAKAKQAKTSKNPVVAKAATRVVELSDEIAKLKDADPNKSEEELLKNVDPAVRAILEKQRAKAIAAEEAIKKMQDASETQEALAKAKELPHLATKADELAKSFKVIKNANPEAFTQIFDVLKAADKMVADGSTVKSLGTSGDKGVDDFTKAADAAWTEIEQKAEEIKKSGKVSKEAAIKQAISENPDLYKKYLDNLK